MEDRPAGCGCRGPSFEFRYSMLASISPSESTRFQTMTSMTANSHMAFVDSDVLHLLTPENRPCAVATQHQPVGVGPGPPVLVHAGVVARNPQGAVPVAVKPVGLVVLENSLVCSSEIVTEQMVKSGFMIWPKSIPTLVSPVRCTTGNGAPWPASTFLTCACALPTELFHSEPASSLLNQATMEDGSAGFPQAPPALAKSPSWLPWPSSWSRRRSTGWRPGRQQTAGRSPPRESSLQGFVTLASSPGANLGEITSSWCCPCADIICKSERAGWGGRSPPPFCKTSSKMRTCRFLLSCARFCENSRFLLSAARSCLRMWCYTYELKVFMNRFHIFLWSFVILVKVFSKNDTLNSGLDACSYPGNEVV